MLCKPYGRYARLPGLLSSHAYYFVGQHAGSHQIRAWFDGTKHILSQSFLWVATNFLKPYFVDEDIDYVTST